MFLIEESICSLKDFPTNSGCLSLENRISASEKLTAFQENYEYWLKRAEQHKIASFPTLSLFLDDADRVHFSEIKDDRITYLMNT
ncbi:hypothetical protein T02_16468 [Trichinella nativa]|uniref:Uncharacterized protein n=2 Tax=Trichinella TaxID=6333 RepID=A0A0V1LUI1_9BILA|nr:hypothetical protein T05_4298 [Trichinella murrelli]KRX83604.1 hypothetical protein T06_8333 [Trichinella sp. T6]KRZ63073.1 hypothetical protein T02_16468 [Trichinella nativa]